VAFRLGLIVFCKTVCSSSTFRLRAKRFGETSPKPRRELAGRRRERHEVHVVLASHDLNALTGVAVGVRVLEDVEHVVTFDVVRRCSRTRSCALS